MATLSPSDTTSKHAVINNTQEITLSVAVEHDLVSEETKLVVQWICYAVIGQIISVFGTITNIINIICFVKQGFKDPVNISLLGLSVSDLLSLVTITWTNICYNPAINALDLPFDTIEIQLLTGAWPHVTFTHITSWITAFVALERFLAVTIPIKVKTIVTPQRVTIIIVAIYAVQIVSISPVYAINSYGMKYSPARNKTILGIVYAENREDIEMISHALNNVLFPIGAFVAVIVFTVALVVNLKRKSKWRESSTPSGQSENFSNRDRKVTKMVIMISSLFIVCFFPVCAFVVAMLAVPQLSMGGRFTNLLIVMFSFGFVLESTNSAINIFIYYYMSSRYRNVFRQIMLWQ